ARGCSGSRAGRAGGRSERAPNLQDEEAKQDRYESSLLHPLLSFWAALVSRRHAPGARCLERTIAVPMRVAIAPFGDKLCRGVGNAVHPALQALAVAADAD